MAKSKAQRPFIKSWFSPILASEIGVSEAIIISHVMFWMKYGKKDWVYNSMSEYAIQLPFFTKSSLQKILHKLVENEYIFRRRRGRTGERKWSYEYSVNVQKIDKLLEVKQCRFAERSKSELGCAKWHNQESLDVPNGTIKPENTDKSITDKSFCKNLPIDTTARKENLSPRLDTLPGIGTELTPNNLANIQQKCPTASAKLISKTWIEQEGYWRDKNLSNYLLEGKVIARIINQEAKKKKKIFVQE